MGCAAGKTEKVRKDVKRRESNTINSHSNWTVISTTQVCASNSRLFPMHNFVGLIRLGLFWRDNCYSQSCFAFHQTLNCGRVHHPGLINTQHTEFLTISTVFATWVLRNSCSFNPHQDNNHTLCIRMS